MPNTPKLDKGKKAEDEYEVVSFDDFCDTSSGSKTDLLTLNDNINYRLCYESETAAKLYENDGGIEKKELNEDLRETTLDSSKNKSWKNIGASSSFAPFGRGNKTTNKSSPFSGVIPKPKNDGESTQHRYERFSLPTSTPQPMAKRLKKCGSTLLLIGSVVFLSACVYWAVCDVMESGIEHHYQKLWERTHHATVQTYNDKGFTEYHYHDHNNLSTKNKANLTDKAKKKPEFNKKSSTYTERTLPVLNSLCAKVSLDRRFDCFPQGGANEEGCVKRGCCWKPAEANLSIPTGIPYCFYPPEYDTFHFVNMTENKHGISVYYDKLRPSGYPDDFETARIDFKYLSNDVLQIKITDALHRRFEPPYPLIPSSLGEVDNLKFRVVVNSALVGFKVIRNDDNVTIMDTQNVGGLILSDKFLQLSTLLPTHKLYGIGEKQASFKVNMDWQTYTLFNSDSVPVENKNLYGTHPFHLGLEDSGKSHGLLLLNSNAMDIVSQPTPALTYRTVGGVLELYLIVGNTPSRVTATYTALVGRPTLPPYWALGFHLCKFNYGSLNVTEDVWQRNRDAGLPFDVQWNDLDYMEHAKDFTYDKIKFEGLPQFVDKLHNVGMHYVILIDPGISGSEKPGTYPPFDKGLEMGIFVKNSTNQPFVGKVWNEKSTVFPDFTHPRTLDYWMSMMSDFHKQVKFDGAWIDMNEPSNFVSGTISGSCGSEKFPYVPLSVGQDGLKTKTLCMDARHYGGPHQDVHNLYALSEAIVTYFALSEVRGLRPFIISRATFVGAGHVTGHWSGDVASTWHDMRMTIPELLSFSLFGIPLMGSDICGFRGNTTEELCRRWMELGAFYPFARNHNSDSSSPQDPATLGGSVLTASIRALRLRYTLLPVYYTSAHRASVEGRTVATPAFFVYPTDVHTHNLDTQFMIGSDIMIVPILEPNTTITKAYIPDKYPWLSIATETYIKNGYSDVNENETVLVRPGRVLPLQPPPTSGHVTTRVSRAQPLQLLVTAQRSGVGELYWDDGDSLNSYEEQKYSYIKFHIQTETNSLNSSVLWWGYGVPNVNMISIYGIDKQIQKVFLNNDTCDHSMCKFKYDISKKLIKVTNINLSLDKSFILTWTYSDSIVQNVTESFTNEIE